MTIWFLRVGGGRGRIEEKCPDTDKKTDLDSKHPGKSDILMSDAVGYGGK